MRSRLILNILLFLLVAGLGAYLFYEPGEENEKPEPLTRLQPDTIDTITIVRHGLDEIRFVNEGGEWMMQAPYHLPAHPVRIRQLLQLSSQASHTQLPVKDIDLSRFQLDEPQASVILNGTRIDFGDTHPLNENRYVRIDETVHLIDDSLFQQLRTSPAFYLDNRLFPGDREVIGINLPGLALQNFDGVWTTGAAGAESDVDAAQLAQSWKDVRAVTVQRYEPAEPYGQVSFEFSEGEPLVFELVGDPTKPVLARTDLGIQYHLSGYDKERLFPHEKEEDKQDQMPGNNQPGADQVN